MIDEAGARVRLKNMTPPPDLTEIESQDREAAAGKGRGGPRTPTTNGPPSLRDEAQQLLDEKTQMQKKWYEENKETTGVVDAEIIAEVVSKMTGVPLTRLEKKETQRLLELEDELHKTGCLAG